MQACQLCHNYAGISRPKCPEGKRLYKQVVETRRMFEQEDGSYADWVEAWDDWEGHFRPSRKKRNKEKSQQKSF